MFGNFRIGCSIRTGFTVRSAPDFAIYSSIGLLITFIYTFNQNLVNYFNTIYKYYLFIPLAISILFILLFIIILLLIVPFYRTTDKYNYSENINFEISYNLLLTIKIISSYDSLNFIDIKNMGKIIHNIIRISELIKILPFNKFKFIKDKNVKEKYLNASQEFFKIIDKLLLPNKKTKNDVIDSLIKYFNIFIKGDMSILPQQTNQLENNQKIEDKSIFHHYSFIIFYLTLPIIIFIIINQLFNITYNDLTKTLLQIAYITWIVVGIISNSFLYNEETKTLLKDLLSTIFNKK